MAPFDLALLSVCLLQLSYNAYASNEPCYDYKGNMIPHGDLYIPGPPPLICSTCQCYHGSEKWCKAIFCPGPPWKTCENYVPGTDCCEFICLDHKYNITKKAYSKRGSSSNVLPSLLTPVAFLFIYFYNTIFVI